MIAARWERSPVSLKTFIFAKRKFTHSREADAEVVYTASSVSFLTWYCLQRVVPLLRLGISRSAGSSRLKIWRVCRSTWKGAGLVAQRGSDWISVWLIGRYDPPAMGWRELKLELWGPGHRVGPDLWQRETMDLIAALQDKNTHLLSWVGVFYEKYTRNVTFTPQNPKITLNIDKWMDGWVDDECMGSLGEI